MGRPSLLWVMRARIAAGSVIADRAMAAATRRLVARAATRAEACRAGEFVLAAVRFVGRLLGRATVAFAFILLIGLGIGPFSGRYRTVTVLSGSMRPTLPIGGVAISTPERLDQVRVGQIVSFRAPVPGGPVETHRVISVVFADGHPVIRTKGDANAAPDVWSARLDAGPVWQARAVVPHLGALIHALRAPTVRRLAVWVAPACFVLVALCEIWNPRRPEAPVVA